ncbi:MAG TPA: CoA transferase [Streptosporangiaceae bacterium]|jgi:crotonobetainyl-CoA:carnitine CoA-transferase CaiB-like acyl-CoA transferase|nr:CoA transferase [Streptosporangiaceae bacterium]
MVTGLLGGLRVLDLTRFVSGSQATMLLAAMGADVVKIEVPPGDPYRWQGTERVGGESALFLALNAGKRSVAIDFRTPAGRRALEPVLASADMLVENSRPGSLVRHGLDWESVHARYPRLVYGSISGYGDVGPDAGRGGFDLILQAESGLMSVTGTEESGPVKVGAPVLDVGAGLSCALGMLAACIERQRTGIGRLVSSSLLEFALATLGTVAASVMISGEVPGLLGTHSPTFAPYGGFRTADGWLVLAGAGSEEMWARACRVLGLQALLDDERFADNARRVAHRDQLTGEIEAVLTTRPTAHWLASLAEAGVPAAEVADLAQALDGPQAKALGAVQELGHPPAGAYRLVGPPLRVDQAALDYPAPAPRLGSDTRAVLGEAGLSQADIDGLARDGVVVAP